MSAAEIRARMAGDGADDVRSIEVPKWGTVYVRDVTAGEFDKWSAQVKDRLGDLADIDQTAFAAAIVICDEKGHRVFDPLDPEDIAFLSKRRKRDLNLILQAGVASGN